MADVASHCSTLPSRYVPHVSIALCSCRVLKVWHVTHGRNKIPEKPPSNVSPPDPPCSFWPRSWLKPTPPPTASPGPPGRPELREPTASAPTSDGWPNMSLPSGCRAPTSTSWPHLTSSTRPLRSVSLRLCFSGCRTDNGKTCKQKLRLTFHRCFVHCNNWKT